MEEGTVGRRRLKELEVMVAEAIIETHDATTLVLFTGNDTLDYKPGHFLTIDPHQFEALERFTAFLEDLKQRREPPRAYSLSSAPDEKYLAITVKEEQYVSGVTRFPPLVSPMLVKRTTRGMRLVVTGFTGPYTLPERVESTTDHLVHIVAGSGAVPSFSILKHVLVSYPRIRQTFVYSNKSREDVIFWRDLDRLATAHPHRLSVIHTLTREVDATRHGPNVRSGRIDEQLLREVIPDPQVPLVYVCGPGITAWDRARAKEQGSEPQPRFLETVQALLRKIGVPEDHIKRESYG